MWHDADGRLDKAVQRFDEGDREAARAMLRGLDRRGVVSPRIDLYLGHCHLEDDQVPAALRRYRRSAALSPRSAAPWMGLGLCYGRLGHVEKAIAAFEAALERDPALEEAHCNLVHCHALRMDLARAEQHARQALALDPRCPHIHRHLAMAYLLDGQPERSLDAWLRVRAADALHPELDLGLARAWAAAGRRREAREAFHRALAGPHASDAAYGLGDLARTEGHLDEAVAHFRSAVRREPAFDEARFAWARCLVERGAADDALDVLAKLLDPGVGEANPSIETVALAAEADRSRGRRRAGLARLRACVAGRRDEPGAWNALARHLLAGERPRAALRVLAAAPPVPPGGAPAEEVARAALWARALGRGGRLKAALRVLAAAVFANPREVELQLDLAAALVAARRHAAAERALLRSISRRPESADLWAGLAELALEDGRVEQARARVRAALRRDRRQPLALGLLVRIHRLRARNDLAARAGMAADRVCDVADPIRLEWIEALLDSGRTARALAEARAFVNRDPGLARAYELLGRALEATGDLVGADRQRRLGAVVRRVVPSDGASHP